MSRTRLTPRRRLVAGLTPVALVLGALPLLAPTCGDPGEGLKTFSRNSIIIPMDLCYQRQSDGTGISYTPAPTCPQAPDDGDVIRAYGLVYQLIRNDIAVYWVINNTKTTIEGIDLTVSYASGFPATYYDWTPEDPPPASPPTALHEINYRGGPFVVDGSDYARASAVLQNFRATFGNVNVHVSGVAFQGYAKRTMAGGWSAGGTVAPKVALLDIGSTSNVSGGYAKNSEPIIRGYLARAGLDFPGAGGVATDTGHGQIYDRLDMADLQPSSAGGSWTTSNLARYGYQILWVPHWFAPGSCANASTQTTCVGSLYPEAQREQAIATVGAFVAAGNDLFAECAGLGSFEGVASGATGWHVGYSDGDASTHFHVTNGLAINKSVGTAVYDTASVTSPLLQLGDYPFRPRSGAIQNYKPATGRSPASTYTQVPPYAGGVARLFTDAADPSYDYFTFRPPEAGRGTTVYLGGHVYSGYADTLGTGGTLQPDPSSFAIGGTRLVLNTLFNLGAACTESGVACSTGLAGICAQGTIQCQGTPAVPVCTPTHLPGGTPEICNGLDDDCDWEVDEGLEVLCYDGPGGTQDVGLCRSGISSCVKNPDDTYSMSACVGQVLPGIEVCNGLDDNCNGATDELPPQPCYEGPSSSIDPSTGQPRPACQAGQQTCTAGSWGACVGQILPRPEVCEEAGSEQDDDCNGVINDTCTCANGTIIACYTGPSGTLGVGQCQGGTQTCSAGAWGPCVGQVLPSAEVCGNGTDENCDGSAPVCPGCTSPPGAVGAIAACNSLSQYPGALPNTGQCQDGSMTCRADNTWGACAGEVLPSPFEACDNVDNDCDGIPDDGAICPTRFVCLAGVCVPDACGVEVPPPEGYACDPDGASGTDPDGEVIPGDCGGTGPCPDGNICRFGTCEDPCASDPCAEGSVCGGGACIAGACYATGCPDGQLCRQGACVADPCQGVLCPGGTFCREGDCVQACAFVSCFAGERCGEDGFCVPDPCAGVSCGPGQRCANGVCAANPCASKGCAQGQVCTVDGAGEALCVDDPCSGITCPAGVCSGGQCFSTANPTGQGVAPAGGSDDGGCGCGSGGAAALPALLALLAAPLARRRRRGGGPGGKLVLLVAASALLASACQKDDEDPFDPATCDDTCGEQRCVDVAYDAAHCGACGNSCGTGEICVDAVCGPSTAVAPYIQGISPSSGPPGALAPVTVQVSGERFTSGATVRVLEGFTTRTYPATFVSASQLTVSLDLSAAPAGSWRLRVVNPDKVISNSARFDVVVQYPAATAVTPSSVVAGQATEVLVTGTSFTSTSQCHLRSTDGTVAEMGLPSSVDAGGVHCTVDASGLSPGTYEIWIVNEGSLESNRLQLLVVSDVAVLLAVSPSSGEAGSSASLTVTGTGFDLSSRVLFDGCAGPGNPSGCPPTAPIVTTTFVDSTRLTVALALPNATGTHTIAVQNGSATPTSPLDFVVATGDQSISSFSPATAYQGEVVTLTFTGLGFPAGSQIQVQPPSGAFAALPATTVSCPTTCTASGTLDLVGDPEGNWLARLDYGSGLFSEAWPLRVLSNQAILQSLSPRSGAQGASVPATLGGANLRPPYSGIRVRFRNAAGTVNQALDPPDPVSSSANLTVTPNLVGLDTGTYTFTIENPNATPSNALSFNVTPGQPTVTSVCRLEGSACAVVNPTQAQQGPTAVPVRITGTNFAKPDASGNGSVVMVTADILPGWNTACPSPPTPAPFQPVPGTFQVVSPTEIVVQLDTLSALAGTIYYVAVWNPGGAVPPQESYPCPSLLPGSLPAFTILP